ncbi:MAG: Aspartyl/glutamyl-tRNA(Asn/Gln) amidotransferase subunit B [Microgenomates group bacterium GW2011_GWF2_45_18]|nr:MAG: Aspartyl/glutamyl-tRNA(Asn/Gln) amidotransferase subunit B [Microgenomates group bacterium GW2011_GWF1_44_10]KKU01553.1 MAG: Aspartyl/glutamyl-tRNA(Asn/Gln) amidotransferase subunit B [Microgenomates group bacterium GW2011_GWF2_45_18]OGJ41622.1 MAG: hypothetical protein A2378_01270 [Candidatus Pacebacteria bacterium RIFOXYB1_FULL_44_10]HAU99462.1 Asp-tRNA(Asn)/Glu-tRNA(Gln) amidotransferase GatCAB subunit B [Candidatus Paceibacterota bacterium]HAX01532.1 Asp-tRNA(Asn)/Glu-tRNA(Gln) amid
MTYFPIIGLEIHVELKTNSKMFCGCKNDPFGAGKPNIYTCPVCLGMPGALPRTNRKAVEWTQLLGLALHCNLATQSKFDRKHYFYPDLPKGYQISQYDQPLCENGYIDTSVGRIGIRRVHLEEDTAKMQHILVHGTRTSCIDFNRSGVPLVEIVTEPDIRSPQQAREYAKKIQEIVRTLHISDADMEKGSMRLEANISLSTDGKTLPAYKVEVKNINSFRFLEKACTFELERHEKLLTQNAVPVQETRGWSESKNGTVSQRSKENAEDYRYFPEPDLPPMRFSDEDFEKIRAQLPELPEDAISRYILAGIPENIARTVAQNRSFAGVIDALLVSSHKNMVVSVAQAIVNKKVLVEGKSADVVVAEVTAFSKNDEISESNLQTAVHAVIEEQEKAVADFRSGKQQVLGFLVGMVIRKLGKKIDAKTVAEKLHSAIQA